MARQAVIIGGGIGGLATANLLAKAGWQVDLYESRHQLGGRMGMDEVKGFRFDTGPSWYLMPEVYDRYYQLLGTSAKQELDLVKLTPAYQVFYEGRPEPLTIVGKEKRDAHTFEAEEPGAGAALTRYLDNAERVYQLAQKYFLYTTFDKPHKLLNSEVLKHGPAMLSQSGRSMHSLTKKYFKSTRLQQLLEYPAVFLGSSPFSAPALYSLMSYLDFRQGVFYPQRGMFTITESMEKLGQNLGVRFHTKQSVAKIIVKDGRATGIKLTNGKVVNAEVVISNADLHFTQTKLLAPSQRDYPASYWQKKQAGPSALLMYLGVKGELPQLTHHNLFFVKDWKANFDKIFRDKTWPQRASIYVCKPSLTDKSVAPAGHENIFVLVPLPADANVSRRKLEQYAKAYRDQIAEQAGIDDLEDRIVYQKLFGPQDFAREYNSWQGTALGLSHELKQSAMFRPRVASKKVAGLYYVGANVQPGIGVPMCLISAELVAQKIAKDNPDVGA